MVIVSGSAGVIRAGEPRRAARILGIKRGFTLVELVAVMVVTGLMSVVAVVSLSGMSTVRSRTAARAIAADLAYARDRALSTGTRTWVSFDVGANRYSVLSDTISSPGRAGAVSIDDPATGRSYVVSVGELFSSGAVLQTVSITGGGTDLGFDRLGRPQNASGAFLTSSASVSLVGGAGVTIDRGTGLASLQ